MQADGGSGKSLCTELRDSSLTGSQANVGKVSLKEVKSKGGSVRASILELKEAKL